MYDGNKMLTLSHGEVSNNYYITIKSSTLVLYMGDVINGTWTEETYIKPPTNKPQGGTAGAPAKKMTHRPYLSKCIDEIYKTFASFIYFHQQKIIYFNSSIT